MQLRTMVISEIKIGQRVREDVGDLNALALSIREVGLLQPIVITEDCTLIAGARRLLACRDVLGWKNIPAYVVNGFKDVLKALKAEGDENTCRLNFSPGEAVNYGQRIEGLFRESARRRMLAGKPSSESDEGTGRTDDNVAEAVGMGRDAYRKAKEIVTAAEADPEEFGKIAEQLDRTRNVNGAYKHLQAKRRIVENRRALEEVAATAPDDRWQLIHGDMSKIGLELEPASIDVLITDPPYPEEYLYLYGYLGELAARVLKPGGSAFVMIGQSYLAEVLNLLGAHLRYQWTLAYLTPGGQAVQLWQRKVNTFWKPVLWFVNGEYSRPWLGDVVQSRVNDNDKRFHEWGQSESGMRDLVERCSRPNDLILDPFCGAGTTGVVALASGRRFVGIDSDAGAIETSRARIIRTLKDQENEPSAA